MQRTLSILIAAVLILVTIGLIMLFSASMVRGDAQFNDTAYFVKRQGFWLGLSIISAIVCARLDLRWMRSAALPLAAVFAVLLVAVWIPGIGVKVNGSWRWLRVGLFTIQPSEFAKIAILLAFSWWISTRRRYMYTFRKGLLPPLIALGVFALLLLAEPDFGTTILVGMVTMVLLYAGGVRPLHLFGFAGAGLTGVAILLLHNENRMRRIFAFLDPEKYAQVEAWQLINGLNAFASGGATGVGLGNSIQKYHYLPESHTDFILPIIGEEFGLISTLLVLFLFLIVFLCGLRIAARASDDFGRFTALGITLMITFQAVINLAVVTGCMPTKGLALPFISYGGSSLLASSAMIGILINVAHTARDPQAIARMALFKDRLQTA
ncbi:MAG: putative lipid II flippase FtsW [Pontiellaceae bacterium]|jgi:cell division protein FtsW|nr:putative lipid II flippase FtsW [Pontiellaceae bacterium]